MKTFVFVVLSAAYALIGFLAFMFVSLSCGLGPNSPAACNDAADWKAKLVAVVAIGIYGVLAFYFWCSASRKKH